jgi:hypothetical protein
MSEIDQAVGTGSPPAIEYILVIPQSRWKLPFGECEQDTGSSKHTIVALNGRSMHVQNSLPCINFPHGKHKGSGWTGTRTGTQ